MNGLNKKFVFIAVVILMLLVWVLSKMYYFLPKSYEIMLGENNSISGVRRFFPFISILVIMCVAIVVTLKFVIKFLRGMEREEDFIRTKAIVNSVSCDDRFRTSGTVVMKLVVTYKIHYDEYTNELITDVKPEVFNRIEKLNEIEILVYKTNYDKFIIDK